jgi:hypothetical protein
MKMVPSVGAGGRPAKNLQCLQPFNLTPVPAVAPVITTTPILTAKENVPYTYAVESFDGDGDQVSYSLTTAPGGMTINAATGVISWTPGLNHQGNRNVTVRAMDSTTLFTSQSFTIAVANNIAPVITSAPTPAQLTARVNVPYTYTMTATDSELPITYGLRGNNPSGLTIAPTTGVVSWTPTLAQVGNRIVRLQATDATGLTTNHPNFTVVVTP